jgi:hypothetical protein
MISCSVVPDMLKKWGDRIFDELALLIEEKRESTRLNRLQKLFVCRISMMNTKKYILKRMMHKSPSHRYI